jgi:ribosomal protein S18 acetylase RimI-like enzyme
MIDARRIYAVIDATWPAQSVQDVGGWTIRAGAGGGSRVSAATGDGDIATAETAMRDLGQTPLFMIRAVDAKLDADLAARGYAIKDPVTLYAARIDAIATDRPPPVTSFASWPPLRVQAEVWAAGGIGPARLAVMARAALPKTTLLARCDDQPAGSAYVGIDGECAMIHALEIAPEFRRRGLARHLTRAAAFWARDHGAACLTLVTTDENVASNALYASLGMQVVGHYHYRIHPDQEAPA